MHNRISIIIFSFIFFLFLKPHYPVNAATVEEEYQSAIEAYEKGEYGNAILRLKKLLDELKLTSIDRIIETHSILAACYLNENDESSARRHFKTLLNFDPEHELPSDYYSPKAVEFFNVIKENKVAVKKPKVRKTGDPDNENSLKTLKIETDYKELKGIDPDYRNPYYNNFIPFGYGQFNNNEISKGYVLMISETVSFASLISTAVAYKVLQSSDGTFENHSTGRGLKAGFYSSLAIFSFTALFGIIDSILNYREYPYKEDNSPKISFAITPYTEYTDGTGLNLLIFFNRPFTIK